MTTAKKIPYMDTGIPYTRTKADIEELLKKYGAKGVRWTEIFSVSEPPILEFIMDVEVQGIKRRLGFKMKPPILMQKKRSMTTYGSRIINIPNLNASLRLMWWYLKSKLEAISYGLETFEREFLAQVMMSLPSGDVVTVGDIAQKQIAKPSSDYILPTFEIRPPKALEEKVEQ